MLDVGDLWIEVCSLSYDATKWWPGQIYIENHIWSDRFGLCAFGTFHANFVDSGWESRALQQLSAHIRFGHAVNLHSPLPSVVSAIALLHTGAEIHARFETYVVVHLEHICTIVPMCEGSTPIEIYTW